MATNIISVQDGPRLTVSSLLKSPTLIPKRVLHNIDQEFLVNDVLRHAQDSPSGALIYFQSTPLFSNDDPAILDEFGEIPTTNGSLGTPKTARTVRRALGLRVSKTMVDRNNVDAVNVQVTQIRNTMVRAWEDAFFSALVANDQVQVIMTDTAWGSTSSHIRQDVNSAKYLVKNAAADAAGKQKFGYVADTLIISTETETDFLDSDEVTKPYVGNLADENVQYTGKLPNKFLGLNVLVSWRLSVYAPSCAVVLQRFVIGGISDERPLSATPMYGEGNGPNGGPTETWRTDITRASAIFVDQPLACVFIAGVTGTDTLSVGGHSIDLAGLNSGAGVTGDTNAPATTPSTSAAPETISAPTA
jgi:hypothetical protein